MHVYLATKWEGEPTESEEMKPAWFAPANIPYQDMWPDDPLWLPSVLDGKYVEASFTFGQGDDTPILKQNIKISVPVR